MPERPQEAKVWEEIALYRIALSQEKPEKEVEKIVEMETFQELLERVEKMLEPVEVWCYDKYIIKQIGSPAITVEWDPSKKLWPAFTTPRDHTGCPGSTPVKTRKQLIVWLISLAVALLEKLEKLEKD